jgi:hypothetical protein
LASGFGIVSVAGLDRAETLPNHITTGSFRLNMMNRIRIGPQPGPVRCGLPSAACHFGRSDFAGYDNRPGLTCGAAEFTPEFC